MAGFNQTDDDFAVDAPRRAERVAVRLQASLRQQSFSKFDVLVSDLSTDGFRCETHYRVSPNSIVWLTIPGLSPLESHVVWANGKAYGCAFTQPLHVAVMEHVARMHPQAAV
jgi:hypothetical protein